MVLEWLKRLASLLGFRSPAELKADRVKEERRTRALQGIATLRSVFLAGKISPVDALEYLETLHKVHGIDVGTDHGNELFDLMFRLGNHEFSIEETRRIVDMLAWEEMRASNDRRASHVILKIAAAHPSRRFIPPLREHLAWAQKETSKEGYMEPSEHMRKKFGLAREMALTHEALHACGDR